MDINQAKSRGFNIFLRFFQLGLQLLIAIKVVEIGQNQCDGSFFKIAAPISYILVGLNLLAMIYIRCREKFPRIQFFFAFGSSLILSGVLAVLGFSNATNQNACAANRVITRFSLGVCIITIIISAMALCLPFAWIQRYSNSPGNLVWPALIFGFTYTQLYFTWLTIIGVICIFISTATFAVNFIGLFKGVTTAIKKVIVAQWVLALLLMIICQAFAIVAYLVNSDSQIFKDLITKKIIVIFVPVNILDLAFWVWGLMALFYENGDKIRDILMSQNEQNNEKHIQSHFHQNQQQPNLGTVR